MALVAYDGSGSSSGSEEDDDPVVPMPSSSKKDNEGSTSSKAINGGVPIRGGGAIFSKFLDIDDEDDEVPMSDAVGVGGEDSIGLNLNSNNDGNAIWSKFLPQPKKVPLIEEEVEEDVEIGPIPPKKTYGDEELLPSKPSSIPSLNTSKVKGKVRISIPFLNSLEEVEPDDANKRKYVEPSKKGSGLFAILPQPKNSFSKEDYTNIFLKGKPQAVKESTAVSAESNQPPQPSSSRSTPSVNRLIPDAVKNRLKRPAPGKVNEIRAKLSKRGMSKTSTKGQKDSDDSDDENGGFFSLDDSETMDPEALEKLKLPTPNFEKRQEPQVYENMEVEEQEYQQPSSSSRSDDLMKFLQPKRGRKEDVQIIDINADDLRPDNTEWLRNITDESAAPARRSKGLGGAVKRKHQITYLAFEAKAREQELKNQWAQNAANKRATNNKYGF